MYHRLVLPLAFLAIVSSKDIEQGQNSTEAHKIFDEKREASPAVWRQIDKVTVNTTNEDVISRVVVTDLRPNKDGDASIIEGGEGNQTVTIELKSPTVLRGYEFNIEVYAVPNTRQHGDVSTPVIVGHDKPKDQWNPSNGDGPKFNMGGNIHPPKTIGGDISTKPPVSLSTDIKFNDGQIRQRITRSPENTKADHTAASKQPSESKSVPITETKDAETPAHPEKSHQGEDSSPSIPHKSVEVSTHLPTTATSIASHDTKIKDEHHIHARDTKKSLSTTQAPSTVKSTKDLKEDVGQEIVFPQGHVDKLSGNTDKPSIPDDHKEVKSEKDGHSTAVPSSTTTDKPRAVRDTDVTSPKTEQKDPTEKRLDQNIQKISSSGHFAVPKEWKNSQDSAFKIGLDKQNPDNTPAPYVPKMPLPMQLSHTRNGQDSSSVKPPKTVGSEPSLSSPSTSDETDSSESSSEEDKKPSTLLTAHKPKGV